MFEMNEEQKSLFDDCTPLQQRMALNSLKGMKPAEAHKEAKGVCKNEDNRRTLGGEILANHCVILFMDAMKAVAVNDAVMSRQEMLEKLSNFARVSMSDLVEWSTFDCADEDGVPVKQSAWVIKDSAQLDASVMSSISELTAGAGGLKIKQHSPLAAMKQLADLEGYNAAKLIDQTVKVVKADDSDW